MLCTVLVAVLQASAALAGSLQLADLEKPRCWVSTKQDAIACPAYLAVRGADDAGFVVLVVEFMDDRMFDTVVVHVGKNYAGSTSFEPEAGLASVRRRLARGQFKPAGEAREIKLGAWNATRPRSRLVYEDEIQLDAALEVDCGGGRFVRDQLVVTGQRFYLSKHPAQGRVAVFGRLDDGDAGDRRTLVRYRLVEPAALCR